MNLWWYIIIIIKQIYTITQVCKILCIRVCLLYVYRIYVYYCNIYLLLFLTSLYFERCVSKIIKSENILFTLIYTITIQIHMEKNCLLPFVCFTIYNFNINIFVIVIYCHQKRSNFTWYINYYFTCIYVNDI